MSEYDDLGPGAAELIRALRAPGTSQELADEDRFVTAYRRAATPRRTVLRPARWGAAGTATVVAIALSSGVAAAAYTKNLPDPLQRAAHQILGPVGVAGPDVERPERTRRAAPPPVAAPTAMPSTPADSTTPPPVLPSRSPAQPASSAAGGPPSTAPAGPASHSPSVAPSSGSPTPPAVRAAALSVSGTTHRVDAGQQVGLAATATGSDGHAVAGQTLTLQEQGGQGWTTVAQAATDAQGAAMFQVTPDRTADYRVTDGAAVQSASWRVHLVPVMTVAGSPGNSTATVSVASRGTSAGDVVKVFAVRSGRRVRVGAGTLDGSGAAQVDVAAPTRHAQRFVVVVPRTARHTAAGGSTRIAPVAPAGVSAAAPGVAVAGSSVTISGRVVAADGGGLPDRRVVLKARPAGTDRWRVIGSARSAADGSVSFGVPVRRTTRYRLVARPGTPATVKVRMQPTLSAAVDGSHVTVTAQGSFGGDVVRLERWTASGWRQVAVGRMPGNGTVAFDVPAKRRQRYRVVLPGTGWHTAATTTFVVTP